jgi:lantibiotic leader peptide-processing serine protease
VPSTAASKIQAAGGSLVYSYPEIGVAIATSGSSSFGTTLAASDRTVQGAVANADFGSQLRDVNTDDGTAAPTSPGTPAPGSDSLSALQWDMDQIQAPQARAINGGSPSVTVGDIDTGLDWTHPDLASNVDYANSVSCIGGTPNTSPSA